MQFFIEVLLGGLLSGVMYALVALGFVLIYKASGVFNFAQGAMVFFAALTFVGFQEKLPGWLGLEADSSAVFWLAFILAFGAMILLGFRGTTAARNPVLDDLVVRHVGALLLAAHDVPSGSAVRNIV